MRFRQEMIYKQAVGNKRLFNNVKGKGSKMLRERGGQPLDAVLKQAQKISCLMFPVLGSMESGNTRQKDREYSKGEGRTSVNFGGMKHEKQVVSRRVGNSTCSGIHLDCSDGGPNRPWVPSLVVTVGRQYVDRGRESGHNGLLGGPRRCFDILQMLQNKW